MGNMQFVGHLYRKTLITEKIVNMCIQLLLDAPIAEELECVCKLLRTVGANLEVRLSFSRVIVMFQEW
jgi:translation initiation factor 4G